MDNAAESRYIAATREAYQNPEIAQRYRGYHTKGITWIRLTMWRQSRIVERVMRGLSLRSSEVVLDAPCGTGLLAGAFRRSQLRVCPGDISLEMIKLARADYEAVPLNLGFARYDITCTPFRDGSISVVVTIGLFHRLPKELRLQVISEFGRIVRGWVIVSFSIDSIFQRMKRALLRKLFRSYRSAPCPTPFAELVDEIHRCGFMLRSKYSTVPWLSSEVICLFERTE